MSSSLFSGFCEWGGTNSPAQGQAGGFKAGDSLQQFLGPCGTVRSPLFPHPCIPFSCPFTERSQLGSSLLPLFLWFRLLELSRRNRKWPMWVYVQVPVLKPRRKLVFPEWFTCFSFRSRWIGTIGFFVWCSSQWVSGHPGPAVNSEVLWGSFSWCTAMCPLHRWDFSLPFKGVRLLAPRQRLFLSLLQFFS